MKRLIFLPALLLLAACAADNAQPEADAGEAMRQGREAAEAAVKERPGTMARERAILQIRANEQKMRQRGDSADADAYVRGAQSVFDSIPS